MRHFDLQNSDPNSFFILSLVPLKLNVDQHLATIVGNCNIVTNNKENLY
jgi:hypothetical protein